MVVLLIGITVAISMAQDDTGGDSDGGNQKDGTLLGAVEDLVDAVLGVPTRLIRALAKYLGTTGEGIVGDSDE